jgi:hypothetical protein
MVMLTEDGGWIVTPLEKWQGAAPWWIWREAPLGVDRMLTLFGKPQAERAYSLLEVAWRPDLTPLEYEAVLDSHGQLDEERVGFMEEMWTSLVRAQRPLTIHVADEPDLTEFVCVKKELRRVVPVLVA